MVREGRSRYRDGPSGVGAGAVSKTEQGQRQDRLKNAIEHLGHEKDSDSFAQRRRQSIGQESDLSWVIFAGGLGEDDVDSLVKDLTKKENELKEELTPHVGKPESKELPEDSGTIIGSYTKEDAERWIAEYEQAMSEVPEADI